MNVAKKADKASMMCPHAEKVFGFVESIGLPIQIVHGAVGFIEHVRIVGGGLHIDPRASASTILHEAGHLAVMPACYRQYLNGDVGDGVQRMFQEMEASEIAPDSPLMRAALQAGDPEATAWAFAAGVSLGLPIDVIILDHEYGGEGEAIRIALAAKSYIGIHGIAHAGFCVVRANPYSSHSLPTYPELSYWLQE